MHGRRGLVHTFTSVDCRMGVEKVWEELAGGDPAMLEPFENFLGEVVLQIKNNQQDKNKLQGHIKK